MDVFTEADDLKSYPYIKRKDLRAAHSFAAEPFKEKTFVAIGKLAA